MDKPNTNVVDANLDLILGILTALAEAVTDGEDVNSTGWEDVPNGSHVRPLDETNFQETIKENCCVLVFFHAKWCVACAPFKPVYAEVAASAPHDNCYVVDSNGGGCRCRTVIATSVDCTRDFTLPMACAVDRLPSVMMFVSGDRVAEYVGDRTTSDLREFVRRTLAAHKRTPHLTHARAGDRAAKNAVAGRKKRDAKMPANRKK